MSASNDYRYDPGEGPRNRSLRVGDKERDAVSEFLRQRHLEGRLDTDEFQARLDRCLAAKTYAELDALVADLPTEGPESRRTERSWAWRPWPRPLVFLPLVPIAAIAFGAHAGWLIFPLFFLFFFARPLIWRTWGGRYYTRGTWACGPRRTDRV